MKIQLLFIMLGICRALPAQEGNLYQFMLSPVQFNPAFAGVFPATFRVTGNFKSQWASEISPYQIKAGAFEAGFSDDYSKGFHGVALAWYSDRAGETRTGTNRTSLIYSKTFSPSASNMFSVGALFAMEQHVTEYRLLTWESQYDGKGYNPSFGTAENIINARPYLNAGMGVAYTYDRAESYIRANNQLKIRIGLSVNYLNRPNRSLINGYVDRLGFSCLSTGDFILPLRNSKWSFRPVYLMQFAESEYYLSFGLLMGYRFRDESVYTGRLPLFNLSYGVLYRADQGPSVQVIAALGRFEMAAGYDFPISALGKYTGMKTNFELGLRYLVRIRNARPWTND